MTRKRLIIAIIACSVIFALCLGWALSLDALLAPEEPPVLQDPDPTPVPTPEPTEDIVHVVATDPTPPEPTEPEPTEPQDEVFTLTFVGDCTLGSMPSWMSFPSSFVSVVGQNYDLPFQYVAEYFRNDDCTFVNLESVLANDGTPADKPFVFRGPTDYVNILTGSSVECVTLANNHTYDFGAAGYQTTKEVLTEAGVGYVQSHSSTVITTESGLKIGVYGVYFWVNMADLRAEIAQMREAGAEIIVAAAHWGDEGKYRANATQKSIAHSLIDAGVDIVWGHHPHVLQPIEEYNGGIIFYSLGNFSFGGNHNPGDKDTAVLQQQIIRDPEGNVSLGELTVIPCQLSSVSWKNDFQPKPYEEGTEAYDRTLSKLDGTYGGADVDLSYRDDYLDDYYGSKETEPEETEPEETLPEETEPEVTEPEVTEPEETEPEVTEPEVTEPPTTEPEVTDPPATEPEVTDPPATEPEVIDPPATDPETEPT